MSRGRRRRSSLCAHGAGHQHSAAVVLSEIVQLDERIERDKMKPLVGLHGSPGERLLGWHEGRAEARRDLILLDAAQAEKALLLDLVRGEAGFRKDHEMKIDAIDRIIIENSTDTVNPRKVQLA
jgi:hypothetical protein